MTITRTEVSHPSYGGTLTLYYVDSAPVGMGVGEAPVVVKVAPVFAAGYGVTYSREAGR